MYVIKVTTLIYFSNDVNYQLINFCFLLTINCVHWNCIHAFLENNIIMLRFVNARWQQKRVLLNTIHNIVQKCIRGFLRLMQLLTDIKDPLSQVLKVEWSEHFYVSIVNASRIPLAVISGFSTVLGVSMCQWINYAHAVKAVFANISVALSIFIQAFAEWTAEST